MPVAKLSDRFMAKRSASVLPYPQIIDALPLNLMVCDPVDLKIVYLNEESRKTLKTIEGMLPVPANEVVGQCIDIFHKDPTHQRRILADPDNLPYSAKVALGDDEIIVSKTDLKGRITYANRVFLTIAGYTEQEVLGEPHSIIRHPDLPRCIFKLLWDTIQGGTEIFAYVINRCKNGDHYLVYAISGESYYV